MSEAIDEATTDGPDETMALAAAIAALCRPNDVIGLQGTLGAGKTCFVKGLATGLGLGNECRVQSPTFVLLRVYEARLTLYHFDAYRLHDASEMEAIGCSETFASGGVSVVEWADHVAECLPREHFTVSIRVTGARRRHFRFLAGGPGPRGRAEEFRAALAPWAG